MLTLKTNYQTALDNFKADLGLPPSIEVVIEDPLLDGFEFISDEVTDRQIEINELRSEMGEQLNKIDELCPESLEVAADVGFEWPSELTEYIEKLVPYLDRADALIEEIEAADRDQIESDLENLSQVRPDRVEYLRELRASIDRGEILADVEPAILRPESIIAPDELLEQFEVVLMSLQQTKQYLAEIRDTIENFGEAYSSLNNEDIYRIVRETIGTDTSERLTQLSKVALEMSLVQAQARGNSIQLNKVDLHEELAFRIARCFRRDWMNARAALVDQWRLIEFVADDLESELDFVFEGELGNNGNSPFSFRSANGELRGGFRFDAPIVRLSERNNYRGALISYQQARRNFYEFEDSIHANLRFILREINLNKILFELSRQNVRVAIEQVELAQLSLVDPSATALGATTARDLTQAISSLQTAQNQFLAVWVDFEVLRRNLDFDLGTFQFGQNFSWIDPGAIDDSIAERAASMMGIDVNSQCYCDIYDYDNAMATEFADAESETEVATEESFEEPVFEAPPADPREIETPGPENSPIPDAVPVPEVLRPSDAQFPGNNGPGKVRLPPPPQLPAFESLPDSG